MENVPIENKPISGVTGKTLIAIVTGVFVFAGAFFKINYNQEQTKDAIVNMQRDMQDIKQEQKDANNKKQTDMNLLKDKINTLELRQMRIEIILKDKNLMDTNE